MFMIARRTPTVKVNDRILSESFVHLCPLTVPESVPVETPEQRKAYITGLVDNGVLSTDCNVSSGSGYYYSSDRLVHVPPYEFDIVDSPEVEQQWFVEVRNTYDDYYNDEYTLDGSAVYYIGPFTGPEDCRTAALEEISRAEPYAWQNRYEDGQAPNDDPVFDWEANNDVFTHASYRGGLTVKVLQMPVVTTWP
ncbi:MAG: hypothetical protein JSS66_05465 [Armatimonadetes bacterium]|nr:hypothetical protein [Armatimonadota bacterium]